MQRDVIKHPSWQRIAVMLVVCACACAKVDFEISRRESFALTKTSDTRLGLLVASELEGRGDLSGFNLVLDGIDALAARIVMADPADVALDAQYFLITDDMIGMLFVGSLLDAADRGVRVRLLLDDIQTRGYDAGLAGLDSHPHFEVRVFNPFADRRTRVGDLVRDLDRVNRRMHNKSMNADNQVALIGGRNIAAEYFNAEKGVNFGDVDVIGIGPVVSDVSRMFDRYWNHAASVPIPGFARLPDDPAEELERVRREVAVARRDASSTPYAFALERSVDYYLNDDDELYTWAPHRVVYDAPEKAVPGDAGEHRSIVASLTQAIDAAESEFVLISPYFVPQDSGVDYFRELRDRGVEVVVLTNSLASTNHAIVHSGYARARKPLLEIDLAWIDSFAEESIVFQREPETSFWQRLSVGFMRLLPIESQL